MALTTTRTRATSAATKTLPQNWLPTLPKVLLEQGKTKDSIINELSHVLVVFPASLLVEGNLPSGLHGAVLLKNVLARQRKKPNALLRTAAGFGKMPVEPLIPEATLPKGGVIRWLAFDPDASAFQRHQQIRQALGGLLSETPQRLDIVLSGSAGFVASALPDVSYVAAINRISLPKTNAPEKTEKSTARIKVLKVPEIHLWVGSRDQEHLKELLATALAKAQANTLTRALCVLPPNQLTPGSFRALIPGVIKGLGIRTEIFDIAHLKKMGAGAFLAVAQGSPEKDAAIVRLSYTPKRKPVKRDLKDKSAPVQIPHIALVGKGICFDTGGHNLKPARYMAGMHEDMAGAAIALAVIQAAARLELPVKIEAWLALSRNDIGPSAYRQGDIVTALNGRTIEIVHTDAEGRMVLADTLTLAAAAKPDLMIDFATLTGSMTTALGNRMSGFFATQRGIGDLLENAGVVTGERVMPFVMPDDYDCALESQVADVKQCTLDGEADHILAARFLNLFAADVAWMHLDLSAATCKGGLGAVGTDSTGFGAALTLQLLQTIGSKGLPRRLPGF